MNSAQGKILALTWAFAVLTTVNGAPGLPQGAVHAVLVMITVVLGVVLLFRPSSERCLLASAVGYGTMFLAELPAVPNHRVVLAFVALTLVIDRFSRREERGVVDTLRSFLFVLYVFAAFAKLNSGYLNPAVSCAAVFFRQTLEGYGLAGSALDRSLPAGFSIWWAIVSEVLLCFVLLVRRTRLCGIIFGLIFHLTLALDYVKFFANFSATMTILLLSWLSGRESERLWQRSSKLFAVVIPGSGVGMAGIFLALHLGVLTPIWWFVLREVLFLTVAAALIAALIGLFLESRGDAAVERDHRPSSPFFIVVTLVILNGLSPYLGLKTRSAFTMYSNLSFAPGATNHLAAPPSLDLFGIIGDSVTITATEDPELQSRLAIAGPELPYIALCAYLEGVDDLSAAVKTPYGLSYERNGRVESARRFAPLPSDCPGWIARRLLFFGPTGHRSENVCLW